jgi:hypothetical protein
MDSAHAALLSLLFMPSKQLMALARVSPDFASLIARAINIFD